MSRPRFSITHISNQNYPNWKLNVESRYEVLDIMQSHSYAYFLIADDNGDFVEIRKDHCKLGEIHSNWYPMANWSWQSSQSLPNWNHLEKEKPDPIDPTRKEVE